MTEPQDDPRFEQLVRQLDHQSKLIRAWEMVGGVSARVTALEIERAGGQTTKLIVRQHGEVDRRHNPHIAADEFKLLQVLHEAGIAAPEPYYVDESGETFPTPYIIIEYIEGEPGLTPENRPEATRQLATQLGLIHQIARSRFDLDFLPTQEQRSSRLLAERRSIAPESPEEGRIREALEPVWPPAQRNDTVLLHGDYWPGNTLWRGGRLVGIIDWEDAALGDPLADVANARLEILWAFGIEAMQEFTRQYRAITRIDFTNLPWWDLSVALKQTLKMSDWVDYAADEQAMRQGIAWFIGQALDATR